jgi:hypothetical protein
VSVQGDVKIINKQGRKTMKNFWKVILAVSIPVAAWAIVKKSKNKKEKETIDTNLFI